MTCSRHNAPPSSVDDGNATASPELVGESPDEVHPSQSSRATDFESPNTGSSSTFDEVQPSQRSINGSASTTEDEVHPSQSPAFSDSELAGAGASSAFDEEQPSQRSSKILGAAVGRGEGISASDATPEEAQPSQRSSISRCSVERDRSEGAGAAVGVAVEEPELVHPSHLSSSASMFAVRAGVAVPKSSMSEPGAAPSLEAEAELLPGSTEPS